MRVLVSYRTPSLRQYRRGCGSGFSYPRSIFSGNASKTRASLPNATVEQNRQELVAFCQQCWQFTDFRHNKGEIGILPLMVRLLIDTYRTAEHQPGRLRGELTSQEIKKYVAMCLKPGKSTGPDRRPNELTKTMMDEDYE